MLDLVLVYKLMVYNMVGNILYDKLIYIYLYSMIVIRKRVMRSRDYIY